MSAFKSGEIRLLVATTVVEVGVDVPNATLMVIENPERLGLAQLHQLRGRVGRGHRQSACILLYEPPIGTVARERLQTIRDSQDGFHIAERDLALRGPGEVLGVRQTGDVGFRIADLAEHASFEEVAFLLLVGHKPSTAEITAFRDEVAGLRAVPASVRASSDVWVDALMGRITGPTVITDVRFPNEVTAIANHGGIVVRVVRPGVCPARGHISETSLDDLDLPVIVNDGSLDELRRSLLEFVKAQPLTP